MTCALQRLFLRIVASFLPFSKPEPIEGPTKAFLSSAHRRLRARSRSLALALSLSLSLSLS